MYLHIPFCKRLCWFCACRTQGVQSDKPVKSYLDTLQDEIRLVADTLPKDVTLSRLHWGGGTPTILLPADIIALAETIEKYLPLTETAEFSVEIDPSEVDEARLDAFAAVGMNRASIGVQDFDPKIQKSIGRMQSYDTTLKTAEMLRARGIHSLNMDVLYGLPYQDTESVTNTTNQVIAVGPDRVALYGYAHVPWMARRQTMIPEDHLPDGPARLELSACARGLFENAGYEAVGIDHFARPEDGLAQALKSGTLRRNFQGYTEDTSEVLIGVGASAISRFPQGYVQNIAATAAYLRQIREGSLATARGHGFLSCDPMRGRVIEELMCQFTVDLDTLKQEIGARVYDLKPEFQRTHKKFLEFTTLDGNTLTILQQGRPLTRLIAREFDAYSIDAAGHSMAI